jgi:outer membrane receptor protein involved in Fe transport
MISNKRRLASGISGVAIAVALTVATPAWAQSSTSTLQGTAPAGAEVVATQPSTGLVRRTTVGADGTYTLPGLPAGEYRVTAGGAVAQDVVVPVASVQIVDFVAAPAATERGAIVVTSRRPTVETKTSQVNQFVTLHDIASLPQTTRNFLEFADTVPGMQFSVDSSHNTTLRGGAQLNSAVNVFIDGVSQKDFVGSGDGTHGSGSGFVGSGGAEGNGDPGNPFPQLAISEYKVVSSNYTAEYGDAASAIIVAQTKSGTNDFQGEIFGTYTDEHFRASRPDEIASGKGKAHQPSKEYGLAIGGPIVPDIAHFFFTWEHKSLANYSTVLPDGAVPDSIIAQLPADVQSQFGPVTNPFTENLYFGKIDVEPTQNDRIEVTGNLRLEHNFTGGNGQFAASTRVPYRNNVKRGDARWQHTGDGWFNAFRVSYQDTESASLAAASPSPQFDYFYFPNAGSNQNRVGIINVGGPGCCGGSESSQKGWTFADDLTFTNVRFAGEHTLKVGASYGSIQLTKQNKSDDLAYATYSFAVTPDGIADTPFFLQFPNLRTGFGTNRVTTDDKQYSAYVQDNWDVNPRLQINLGLRWDREEVPSFLDYQTKAEVVTALNGLYPGTDRTVAENLATDVPGAPGIDINDYISTGSNRHARNNFSPRVGFSYDLSDNNSLVIFGGYARAYNRNLFATLALETTKVALNDNPEIYFPSPQSFGWAGHPCQTDADVNPAFHCYAWDPAYLTPGGLASFPAGASAGEVDLIRNDIKTPYSDQFSLGVRTRLGDWNAQAVASYVASYEGIYGHWGARYGDGQYYDQGGNQWGAQGVPGIGSLILWDNGFKDRNLQISLGAQKPYTKASGWSATAAYTFSNAKQNNSYDYGAGGNNYLFDYPRAEDYTFLRSSSVPRHRLVLTGTYDLPWDIQVAGKLTLATSTPSYAPYGCDNQPRPGCTQNSSGFYVNQYGGGFGGWVALTPREFIGYKDLDIQVTKNFNFFDRFSAYARVDVINVFNWRNYDATITDTANGVPVAVRYNTIGSTVGSPFTGRLSAGARFGGPKAVAPLAEVPPPPPPPPATQTCPDGSVIDAAAACAAPPPPPPPAPPPPAPVERGERGQ